MCVCTCTYVRAGYPAPLARRGGTRRAQSRWPALVLLQAPDRPRRSGSSARCRSSGRCRWARTGRRTCIRARWPSCATPTAWCAARTTTARAAPASASAATTASGTTCVRRTGAWPACPAGPASTAPSVSATGSRAGGSAAGGGRASKAHGDLPWPGPCFHADLSTPCLERQSCVLRTLAPLAATTQRCAAPMRALAAKSELAGKGPWLIALNSSSCCEVKG